MFKTGGERGSSGMRFFQRGRRDSKRNANSKKKCKLQKRHPKFNLNTIFDPNRTMAKCSNPDGNVRGKGAELKERVGGCNFERKKIQTSQMLSQNQSTYQMLSASDNRKAFISWEEEG